MAPEQKLDLVFNELGRSIGLPDFGYSTTSDNKLIFDDQVIVNFELDMSTAYLTLYSILGEVPREHLTSIYGWLLASNRFWENTAGATLSISEQDHVIMAYKLPINHLDAQSLESLLVSYVEKAKSLIHDLNNFKKDDSLSTTSSNSNITPLNSEHYVRV